MASSPQPSSNSRATKKNAWKTPAVIAALIAALATITAAVLQMYPKPAPVEDLSLSGWVHDAKDPVSGATVTLYLTGEAERVTRPD